MKRIYTNLKITITAIGLAASIFAFGSDFSISAKASGTISVELPTNDLVDVPLPEVQELETEVVDGMAVTPRNAAELNQDVETGIQYNFLDDVEKAKITIVCKNKKIYNKTVKKLKKAGAKKAKFKFKKG